MVKAARANQRVSQVGMHIHNHTPNYRRSVELVKSGMLGKISRVTCWKTSDTKGVGNPPDGAPPPELDYDFWLGPAPKRAYNPNRSHRNFRFFWDYSGGTFIDFWCHITDVVFWAMDLKAPESVAAVGGRFFLTDNTETPDTLDLVYEFPKLDLTWTFNPTGLPGFERLGGIGCVFQGTEASLAVNYMVHELYVKGEKVTDYQRGSRPRAMWNTRTSSPSPAYLGTSRIAPEEGYGGTTSGKGSSGIPEPTGWSRAVTVSRGNWPDKEFWGWS
jgi:predicted dehydrogenase